MLSKAKRVAYPFTHLLDSAVSVCLPPVMFAYEDLLGFSMVKSDKGVLPISDVVTESDIEHCVSKVVAVEEKPESVDNSAALVYHHQDCWRVTSSARYWTIAAYFNRLLPILLFPRELVKQLSWVNRDVLLST